MFVLKENT